MEKTELHSFNVRMVLKENSSFRNALGVESQAGRTDKDVKAAFLVFLYSRAAVKSAGSEADILGKCTYVNCTLYEGGTHECRNRSGA